LDALEDIKASVPAKIPQLAQKSVAREINGKHILRIFTIAGVDNIGGQ
jgi:hypothetical protein